MHQPITGDEPAMPCVFEHAEVDGSTTYLKANGFTKRELMAKDFVAAILSSGRYQGDNAHLISNPQEAASMCEDALMWAAATIKALNQPT